MQTRIRLFLICFAAFCIAILIAGLALVGIVQELPNSLEAGLPRAAVTTPMIGVVVFWGVARAAGVPLDPMRVFLVGGIATYSVLYVLGRLVALSFVVNTTAIFLGALVLFAFAYAAVQASVRRGRQ